MCLKILMKKLHDGNQFLSSSIVSNKKNVKTPAMLKTGIITDRIVLNMAFRFNHDVHDVF